MQQVNSPKTGVSAVSALPNDKSAQKIVYPAAQVQMANLPGVNAVSSTTTAASPVLSPIQGCKGTPQGTILPSPAPAPPPTPPKPLVSNFFLSL
jgi:hypothetical protein